MPFHASSGLCFQAKNIDFKVICMRGHLYIWFLWILSLENWTPNMFYEHRGTLLSSNLLKPYNWEPLQKHLRVQFVDASYSRAYTCLTALWNSNRLYFVGKSTKIWNSAGLIKLLFGFPRTEARTNSEEFCKNSQICLWGQNLFGNNLWQDNYSSTVFNQFQSLGETHLS